MYNTTPGRTSFPASVLAVALIVQPLFSRTDRQVCGTHALRNHEERALHRASMRRRAAAPEGARTTARSAARDVGHIAILDDADGVVARRNDFNLDTRRIAFTPVAGGRYRYSTTSGGFDAGEASSGTLLTGLGDDDTRAVAIPFGFPFFGANYRRVFINSDGNLTFNEGDIATSDRSLGRATAGPPRIAALFTDLDPTRAGAPNGIRVLSDTGRFVVSWSAVPLFQSSGTGPRQTFQIRLFPDGRIEFAWLGVTTQDAVVGIAPGALSGVSSVVSFLNDTSAEYAGALLERFTSFEEVDIVFAAQKFYETHDDAYDYLAIYNNLGIPASPGAVAFEVSVRNDRLGIGDPLVDDGLDYGSPRRLQAMLNMGPLSQYPRDPNAVVPARALSRDTPLSVLGHEAGHLWLAFASVIDPGGLRPMLGRQSAHWSFTFNSEASLLEGNRIQDNGPGISPRFLTVATTEGYSALDQYLMGLRAPEEVPSTFVVNEATTGPSNRQPQAGVSFDGVRRDIAIQELIEAEGRRIPDHTVSQRRFRLGFILIGRAGVEPTADDLSKLDAYRDQFTAYFNRVTGGRAIAETNLLRHVQLTAAPSAGLLAGAEARVIASIEAPLATPLTLLLRTQSGAATVPASVAIAAGQTQVEFLMRGVRPGVEELSAEPADARFATAYARVQVSSGPEAVRLAVISGDKQAATSGSPLPQPLVLRALDRNNVPYASLNVTATVTAGGAVSPRVATTDPDGFARFEWTPGGGQLHELRATIAGNAASTVLLTALGQPTLAAGAVVNAASYAPGLVPGGIATLFGLNLAGGAVGTASGLPLPFELGGVRVLINGRAAQLLYVSDRQINLLVPADTALGEAELTVSISSGSVAETTLPVRVTVRALDPAIFFDTVSGLGAVLVAGSGQSTIDRDAGPGDVLEIYCTGLGALGPADPATGRAQTVARPEVFIGGVPAELLYSGSSSFPGLYQANVRIPGGAGAGLRTLVMQAGNTSSNQVVIRLAR